MPKKHSSKKQSAHVPAVLALAAITVATLASGSAFIGDTESPSTAHANTSANPYQPVQYPQYNSPRYPSLTTSSSRSVPSAVPSLPKNVLVRKIKALERSAKVLMRQLLTAEKRVDALTKAVAAAAPRDAGKLQTTLDEFIAKRDKLEQRLAEINTKIAEYQLQTGE